MEQMQTFSLGKLISAKGLTAPFEVKLELIGRGTFVHLAVECHFTLDGPSAQRVFILEKPARATLVKTYLNRELLETSTEHLDKKALSVELANRLENSFSDETSDVLICDIDADQSLRSLRFEFSMALDVLWHEGNLCFRAPGRGGEVDVNATWDLKGLPDSRLECQGVVRESRFDKLEGSRRMWKERLSLKDGDSFGIKLCLDEQKAASLCLYSGPLEEEGLPGCGAVIIVAPKRPQLLRKAVKLAVVVEIRNPQEGLLTRDLTDQLATILRPGDQLSISFMGSTVTRNILPWTDIENITEGDLAQLIEPSLMGRTEYFWESFQRVIKEVHDATHIVLSSSGSKDQIPDEFSCSLPLFHFNTDNQCQNSVFEHLGQSTGGFCGGRVEGGAESFLRRLDIRVSPPLLKDFRLEGWDLEKIYPQGFNQVYSDRPTLISGLFDGDVPSTAILSGLSPAGQKLAQRVRVEEFTEFSLFPILRGMPERIQISNLAMDNTVGGWRSSGLSLFGLQRPFSLDDVFDTRPESGDTPMSLERPTIGLVAASISSQNDIFGSSEENEQAVISIGHDDIFQGPADTPGLDDVFAGPSEAKKPTRDDLKVTPFEPLENPFGDIELSEEDELASISLMREDHAESTLAFSIPDEEEDSSGLPDEDEQKVDKTPGLPDPSDVSRLREPEVLSAESEDLENTQVVLPKVEVSKLSQTEPSWIDFAVKLEKTILERWLSSCSLDTLSLALADIDEFMAKEFLEQIEEPRRALIILQMEWGKILTPEERHTATQVLEEQMNNLLLESANS